MAENEGVHRLKDILVEEVSLVDHAANKKRFLLVKRDGQMDDLKPNGRGGYTRVAKAKDEEDEDAMKAKGKPFPGAAKPFGADGKPAKPEEDDEEEKAKKAKAKEDEEKAKAKKEQEDGEEGDAVKAIFENEDEEKKAKAKKAIARGLLSLADAVLTDKASRSQVAAAAKVAKAGRKMSGSRLEMFQKAMDTLQSLLAELMETPASTKDHDPDPGDPQAPPKGWNPSNPSMVPSGSVGTAGGWTGGKRAPPVDPQTAKALSESVELIKSLKAENDRLRSGGVRSNSIPVETRKRREAEEVVWPLDMADRTQLGKNDSFLDD